MRRSVGLCEETKDDENQAIQALERHAKQSIVVRYISLWGNIYFVFDNDIENDAYMLVLNCLYTCIWTGIHSDEMICSVLLVFWWDQLLSLSLILKHICVFMIFLGFFVPFSIGPIICVCLVDSYIVDSCKCWVMCYRINSRCWL